MYKNLVIIAFWAFNLPLHANSQPAHKLSRQEIQKIDKLFDSCTLSTPGYAIGIIKGQTVLYSKGFGAANLDYGIPITTSSAFDIASVSKQFTAAALALLIIEKKIDLEDPAFLYLPALKKYRDTIRIKNQVYKTSGIVD